MTNIRRGIFFIIALMIAVVLIIPNANSSDEINSAQNYIFIPENYTVSVEEGKTLRFLVKATSPDNNSALYLWLLDNKFDNSEHDTRVSEYIYNPDFTEGSNRKELELQINDGKINISKKWIIDVENVNRPPVIDNHDPIERTLKIKEGESRIFFIYASDPDPEDKDKLTYVWTLNGNIISNLDFFEFKPIPESANYMKNDVNIMEVRVSDGKEEILWKWFIKVEGVNRAPVIENITSNNEWEVEEGGSINFSVKAYDPDEGNDLIYTWRIDEIENKSKNGSWTYYPTYHDEGEKTVYVTISDGSLNNSEKHILKVINKNGPPNISSLGPNELRFLFTWEEIREKDININLKNYLKDDLDIEWVENPETKKIDENTILVFENERTINITLDGKKAKITLDDGTTYNLVAEKVNNTINIFERYIYLYLNKNLSFYVNASDPEGEDPNITWESSESTSYNKSFPYSPKHPIHELYGPKKEIVRLRVSDGNNTILEEWNIILEPEHTLKFLGIIISFFFIILILIYMFYSKSDSLRGILYLFLAPPLFFWGYNEFPLGIITLFFSMSFLNIGLRKLLKKYCFNNHFKWEEIPKNEQFKNFLRKEFNIDLKNENFITKNDTTMILTSEKKNILLKLDDDIPKAIITLEDGKTHKIDVNRDENGKLSLYSIKDLKKELIYSKLIISVILILLIFFPEINYKNYFQIIILLIIFAFFEYSKAIYLKGIISKEQIKDKNQPINKISSLLKYFLYDFKPYIIYITCVTLIFFILYYEGFFEISKDSTLYYFYSSTVQSFVTILAIILAAFIASPAHEDNKIWRHFVPAFNTFAIIFILLIIFSFLGILLKSKLEFNMIDFYISTFWENRNSSQNLFGIIIFELTLLSIPPALLYFFVLVASFLDVYRKKMKKDSEMKQMKKIREINAKHVKEKEEMKAKHAKEKEEMNAKHAKEKEEMNAKHAREKEEHDFTGFT